MPLNFCSEATVSIESEETRVSEHLEPVNNQRIASAKPKAPVMPALPPRPLFSMAATRVASLPGGYYPLHLSSAWPAAIPANGRHGDPSQIHLAEPAGSPSRGRLNRTRLADALDVYLDEMSAEEQNKPRVRSDKRRVINSLAAFLKKERGVEPDIWVHDIQASDIYWYIRHLRDQPGKVREKGGQRGKSASRTLEKKGRMLDHFFEFACKKLKACEENPVAEHRDIFEKLKQEAGREGRHYLPFTSEQLQLIFDPHSYLRYSNQPDWFWSPLIAAHLGVRAGEVVQLSVDDFHFDPLHKIWFVSVQLQFAKNRNSVRTLPLHQGLIDLGLIDYIERVRSLGGTQLFPHRDYTTATLSRDPSKRVSENFAKLLAKRGLEDPDLVFHSFRHMVVSALHDAGVSLAEAMQICGHEAMEFCVRNRVMTKKQGRSMHLPTYTHPNAYFSDRGRPFQADRGRQN
ncbi:site-specific integrase [Roseateles sp. LKC17W]|uniref:site-specific integrase n=1 Tax=Pelomonas margarita TaxID=3299031 RepID=UPI003747F799